MGISKKYIYLLIVTGILLLFFVVPSNFGNESKEHFNLLNDQSWTYVPGVQKSDGELRITPIGRVITHKDTSTAQLNPPVNVRGPHLKVSGDFEVKASLKGVEEGATFQLYGQVPVIYDEWRQERQSVKINVSPNIIKVSLWDGSSVSSIDERSYKRNIKNKADISIIRKSNKIFVKLNGKYLGSMPDHNVFINETVWFGVDANIGSDGWTLNSLMAKGLNNGMVELVPSPDLAVNQVKADSLRKLSNSNLRKLPIGAAVSIYPLMTDTQYRQTVGREFSIITPENSMKPQFIHPQKNLYTFADADSVVEFAQKNQIMVHGHALVLSKANPQWMQKTPENQRKQLLTDHITEVVSHFKGKAAEWDVVNEPLSEDGVDYNPDRKGIRKQLWFDSMGEEYIDVAFKATKLADPNAKLYLNDFGIEKDGERWDAIVSLVQRLQSRGVPIDGVGFEAHVYHEPDLIDPVVLSQHIQTLAGMGIVSRISEIDVLGDKSEVQAKQFADVLKVCLAQPTCTSYTTWGVSDRYGSTTLSDRYPITLGDSLIWDAKFNPKLSLSTLQNILR